MGVFWRSKAPFTYKKGHIHIKNCGDGNKWVDLFLCLQNIDYETIQKEIPRNARKILGKAAWKQIGTEQKIEYRPISSAEVLRKFGLCTIFTELRVRRIKWVQKMVKCAHRHVFQITALFGVSACDEQEPCDEEGDIQALSYSDNAVEFEKIYKGKLLNLWLEEDTKGLFLKLDATELRAQEKSVAISITEEKREVWRKNKHSSSAKNTIVEQKS